RTPMRSIVFVALTAAAVSVGSVTVGAHHSYAEFQDHTTSIEGTVVNIVFANPHTILTFRTVDGTLYKATWNASLPLLSHGVKTTDLKAGDVVAITGFAHRDPATHEFAKLREVRRVSDGWAWKDENGRQFVTTTH